MADFEHRVPIEEQELADFEHRVSLEEQEMADLEHRVPEEEGQERKVRGGPTAAYTRK